MNDLDDTSRILLSLVAESLNWTREEVLADKRLMQTIAGAKRFLLFKSDVVRAIGEDEDERFYGGYSKDATESRNQLRAEIKKELGL